jgi:hypothetical protein
MMRLTLLVFLVLECHWCAVASVQKNDATDLRKSIVFHLMHRSEARQNPDASVASSESLLTTTANDVGWKSHIDRETSAIIWTFTIFAIVSITVLTYRFFDSQPRPVTGIGNREVIPEIVHVVDRYVETGEFDLGTQDIIQVAGSSMIGLAIVLIKLLFDSSGMISNSAISFLFVNQLLGSFISYVAQFMMMVKPAGTLYPGLGKYFIVVCLEGSLGMSLMVILLRRLSLKSDNTVPVVQALLMAIGATILTKAIAIPLHKVYTWRQTPSLALVSFVKFMTVCSLIMAATITFPLAPTIERSDMQISKCMASFIFLIIILEICAVSLIIHKWNLSLLKDTAARAAGRLSLNTNN